MRGAGVWVAWLAACAPGETSDPSPVADETYLVVDADAGATGADDLRGGVLLWNRTRGVIERFVADPRFVDPQMALRLPGGDALLLDMAAETAEGRGGLFRIDADTRAVAAPLGAAAFDRPVAVAVFANTGGQGVAYVADRSALPDGEARGAVFAIDLATAEARVVARDPRFRAPSFLVAQDDGALLLLDADARTGRGADEGVLFTIDPLTGVVTERARLQGAVSPLGLLPEPDGGLLVFDANADPRGVGGPLGAIFRVDAAGETTLVVSDHPFRDPVRGCGGDDGLVLFVDANADPEQRGPDRAGRGQNLTGPGAILSLDRATGAVRVAQTSEAFVNPVDLVRWR